jgi:hypothetical protein
MNARHDCADRDSQSDGNRTEPRYFRIYGPYRGNGPRFYDPESLPWTALLRREAGNIRDELIRYLGRGGRFQPHFVPDRVRLDGWRGIRLVTARRPYRAAWEAFPHTVEVLRQIPDLVTASFNILEPGASLPAHHGDTNLFYRAHLGLFVPGSLDRCGIEVAGERRGWEEGKVLVFNDAYLHHVWNFTDRPRIILICDVMKREYGGGSRRNCSLLLGAIALMYFQFRVPFLLRLPRPLTALLHQCLSWPFFAYLLVNAWPGAKYPYPRGG